jgi:hypothetical protein
MAWYGGLIVALIPCAILLQRLQTGLATAVSVLVFGMSHVDICTISTSIDLTSKPAALSIGYMYMPAQYDYSSGRDIGLYFVFGVMAGFVLPAFIFLTGAWYTAKELAVRILIWGYSSIVVSDVLYEIALATRSSITYVVFYVIYILLAAACFVLLKPPSQVSWMPASDMSYFSRRHPDWTTAPWSINEVSIVACSILIPLTNV